ncbi:hypothetical protein [Mariniluteicoccus flavus]
MTESSIPLAVAALDELYAHLDSLGAPGQRLIEQTRPWRDAMVHASDSEWARYYGEAVGANLATGLDWQAGPDEQRGVDLLNDFLKKLKGAEASPWADVELRQWQEQQGIGADQLRSDEGRPPLRK